MKSLRQLSWGAADILIAYSRGEQPPYGFSRALNVHNGNEGPVSAADLAVNEWLLDGLELNFSSVNWSLLSEESVKDNSSKNFSMSSEWLWILDPLDGTKDFISGSGDYAVHLALVRDQKPVLGVVLIPEKEELWFGLLGKGAWCENRFGQKRFVSFSRRSNFEEMVLVASRSHRDERLEKLIEILKLGKQMAVGSIGCKIGTILRGESDVFISLSGKTSPKDWDMAAPEALLRAAGGEFTHANLVNLKYRNEGFSQSGCIIGSNGMNHSLLCEKTLEAMSLIDPEFSV